MNNIKFKISPSFESNDYQIRILIDGNDLLGDDYLGLDPHVFNQRNFYQTGELIIGRCACGYEGCSGFPVTVNIDEDHISWTDNNGLHFEFEKADYEKRITEAKNDFSWEDDNRRIERLVTEILNNTMTKDNYSFDWASARIQENTITLSYSKNGEQKLFKLPWGSPSTESVLAEARHFAENKLKRQ